MSGPSSPRVSILTDPKALGGLEAGWNRLARQRSNALLRLDWFATCVSEMPTRAEPRVIIIGEPESPSAIGPFQLRQYGPVKHLEFIDEEVLEPHELGFSDDKAVSALCKTMLELGSPIMLSRIADDSVEYRTLHAMAEKLHWIVLSSTHGRTAHVPLGDQPLEAKMRKSSLAQLRRKLRKAEQMGEVSFEFHTPNADNVEPLLDTVFEVESSGWKGREGTGLLRDERVGRFFRSYARRKAGQGTLHVGIMWIGGVAAAVRLGVEEYGRLLESKIGYREQFAACSPGLLLTHETLKYLEARGIGAHMFLGRYEHWQDLWNPVVSSFSTLRLYPPSPTGWLALAADATHSAVKKLMHGGPSRPPAAEASRESPEAVK